MKKKTGRQHRKRNSKSNYHTHTHTHRSNQEISKSSARSEECRSKNRLGYLEIEMKEIRRVPPLKSKCCALYVGFENERYHQLVDPFALLRASPNLLAILNSKK